ncbi:MAG: glutamine synthetase III [Candidatus Omnitrophica bacterium]|nr:glutamine synthetase III [Candidatus Omnitrophota bacterium]
MNQEARQQVLEAYAQQELSCSGDGAFSEHLPEHFGQNVFSLKVMKGCLSPKAYASIEKTINEGGKLDPSIADEVAEAMKKWAIAKGATHFTHWFQPLTGTTAEKHDSFISWDGQGGVSLSFGGKELIQGEPDASSFPSGGLRATFEARGYTGWDPTSPAFIKEGPEGATLCIPTFYIGYHGEALDRKTPLLRSMAALSKQVCRLANLFGIDTKGKRAYCTVGPEQEYFLIDKKHYEARLDLVQTGRTLFGRKPAKHQQQEDHYFGAIKPRIMAFMEDLDRTLWGLGMPSKTRHNEVAPAQYEIAPIYEELNIGVDHDMIMMEVMRQIADKHGLVCLLHEKPFAGINGSGKHNNWSVVGPDGKNWLYPGKTPHENAKFLTMLCAVIKAVDVYADLLRVSVASAGNDHRLGANEAPPAIVSIFLGDQLTDIIEQIEKGGAKSSKQGGVLHVGVDSLPHLAKDTTDRNRTSPFAFTGAKFEFRAVGSSMNPSAANMVLNTIVAQAISEICNQLEADKKAGKEFNASLQKVLQDIIKKHKRVLYNGDNYVAQWHAEAKKRGLPNLTSTPEALEVIKNKKNIDVLVKQGVFTEKEIASRYEINMHAYNTVIALEGNCAATMARTQLIPAAIEHQKQLADTIKTVGSSGKTTAQKKLLKEVCGLIEEALLSTDSLEVAIAKHDAAKTNAGMAKLRESIDELEGLVPSNIWPLPSYAEMLLMNA